MDNPIVVSARHMDAPWIAANLAVLNEATVNVRLDVDFQVLAAKRTRDQELVWHLPPSYRNAGQPAEALHVACPPTRLGEVPHCLVVPADARLPARSDTIDGSWIGRYWATDHYVSGGGPPERQRSSASRLRHQW
jgi:hypothetical protein